MANRRSASSEGSGIFSSVFSFVSRELESFVTNATGGAQVQYDDEVCCALVLPDNLVQLTRARRSSSRHRHAPESIKNIVAGL